ncbi:hypothetical protein [Nonlabens xiamenensis]|uniref:hypothetical protein n=1 Tax=Nonlabens xiamenensis TaxID=2341043 RepID=UPI000F613B5F|nr:hypothetical protein [Nonlabens xiamenensis]
MKQLLMLSAFLISGSVWTQELAGDNLREYNLFIIPSPQIQVTLSLDSNRIVNPKTGFSVTPGVTTIDMVAIYNESQQYQEKEYIPNQNTDFGRLRFKSDDRGVNFSIQDNDNFAREFRRTNPAFFEANRNTALHRSYNPLSCYRSW